MSTAIINGEFVQVEEGPGVNEPPRLGPTPMAQEAHPLDNGRSADGMPLSREELNDDALVSLPGSGQWTLRELLSTGEVVRRSDGTFGLPGETPGPKEMGKEPSAQDQPPTDQPSDQEPPAPPAQELLDQEFEAQLEEHGKAVPPELAQSIVENIASQADLVDFRGLAEAWGVDGETAEARFGEIYSGLADQAADAIEAATGLEPTEVAEWARRELPDLYAQSVRDQLGSRSTRGYAEMARRYAERLDTIAPDALLEMPVETESAERGLKVTRESDGQVYVHLDGDKTPWANAVRLGMVELFSSS